MFAVALLILVAVGALTLGALWLARTSSLEYTQVRDRLHRPDAQLLAYDVPDGQDPSEVVVALHHAGYTSVEDLANGGRRVLVQCPGGRQRARACVRAVIEAVGFTSRAGVRFADEPRQDES